MNDELAEHIGQAARQARAALRLTQADAAERVGVSIEFYARIERGGTLPSVPTLCRLCSALGVSADVLLGTKHTPSSAPRPRASTERDRRLRRIVRKLESIDDDVTVDVVSVLLSGVDRIIQARRDQSNSARAKRVRRVSKT